MLRPISTEKMLAPQPGLRYEEYLAIPIDGLGLKMLAEKIARGVNYKLKGELIKPDQAVEVFFNEDKSVAEVVSLIKTKGETFYRGPGITVSRVEAYDDSKAILFHMQIWGRLKMTVSILPKVEPPI